MEFRARFDAATITPEAGARSYVNGDGHGNCMEGGVRDNVASPVQVEMFCRAGRMAQPAYRLTGCDPRLGALIAWRPQAGSARPGRPVRSHADAGPTGAALL